MMLMMHGGSHAHTMMSWIMTISVKTSRIMKDGTTEMDRDFKGVWIPRELWLSRDLTGNEKIVLFEIDSFTSQEKPCFISDEYIGELVGVTPKAANRIVSSLVKKGFVEKVGFDGRNRFLRSCFNSSVEADSTQMWKQTPHKCGYTINNIPKTNTNTLSNKKPSRFVKPTVEEIRQYCTDKMLDVDPEQFFNFYESKGWMVGKSPMKNWRAAVATWSHRQSSDIKERKVPQKKESVLQHNLRIADEMFGTKYTEQVYGRHDQK